MENSKKDDEWEKAGRIMNELKHETASIWYISDSLGAKVMIKAPTPAIKSIIAGCRIEFLFGKDIRHQPAMFHTGVRIHDDPVHYLSITGIQRFRDEHTSLESIMQRTTTFIHFYNELNVCVAIAQLLFSLKDQLRVLNMLGNPNLLYIGNFDQKAFKSLDCFDHSLKMQRKLDNVYNIDILIIEGELSGWQIMDNNFIGLNDRPRIIVNDANEGDTFEKQVWVSLESLFNDRIYLNPKIPHKRGTRELTDIFGFSEYGIFLIETKALGIVNAVAGRTMDRKVKGLQQQIGKAIDQLTGAVKKIVENVSVLDQTGKEIVFNRQLLPHCIVLVSDLLPFGDWKDVEMKMMVAMAENKMYLNVMDLKEFMRYVGISRGSVNILDKMLMDRVDHFIKNETIHLNIKEIFPGEDEVI